MLEWNALTFSRLWICCSLGIGSFAIKAGAASTPSGSDILSAIQKNSSIEGDITASVSMTQQKSGQGIKNFEMLYYRRDSDDAFLIFFKSPEAEKGNGYLRVGENFWMYRRNTRSFQHVNRDESIGGTDAQGDDFEDRPITELYSVAKDSTGKESIQSEDLGKIPVYRLDIVAKVNDVDYPKKTLWVRRDNFLPLKELSFANSGSLMQTAYFLKYLPVKEKFLAVEQIFIDEFEKGNRTKLNIGDIQHAPIPPEIFTKAYLENLSK